MVERGADVESKDHNGKTPLIIGIFLNYVFTFNYFFILFTASRGRIEVVKLLLERGASVKPIDYFCSQNALHFGIFNK